MKKKTGKGEVRKMAEMLGRAKVLIDISQRWQWFLQPKDKNPWLKTEEKKWLRDFKRLYGKGIKNETKK